MKRPHLSIDEICEMITTQVTMDIREVIREVFRSIKTTMIEMFEEHYVAISEVTIAIATVTVSVAGHQGRGLFQYQDFSNMKSPGV